MIDAAPHHPARTDTMRAVVALEYGGPELLHVEERPVPTPAADEVLVRVHAAGLDAGTRHLLRGEPWAARLAFGLRRPKQPVPGLDLAGTVEAVGSSVTRFVVGDEVFGIGTGSFAERAVAKEAKLAHRPPALDAEHAAALPVSGLTALQSLRDAGRLQPGQRVLVLGASGGVGSYVVQIAKAMGAHVTGTASPAKAELVRSLGADHVVGHDEALGAGVAQHDLVVAVGGEAPVRALRTAVTPRGTLVVVGGTIEGVLGIGRQLRAVALSPFVRQRLTMLVSKEAGEDLVPLAEMAERGELTPRLDRTYALADAAEAMRRFEAGEVAGKLVLRIV